MVQSSQQTFCQIENIVDFESQEAKSSKDSLVRKYIYKKKENKFPLSFIDEI